jgi:hypothetical protein
MTEVEVAVAPQTFIPGNPTVDLSPVSEISTLTFIRAPVGWPGGWHPTPGRRFVVGLPGELEIQTGDNQVYVLRPGHVVLLEDTAGKGHHSRVLGESDWWGALMALPQ